MDETKPSEILSGDPEQATGRFFIPAPGWRIETGESLFSTLRWACIRNFESQCGQDFYEDRDPLMFSFLMALNARAGGTRSAETEGLRGEALSTRSAQADAPKEDCAPQQEQEEGSELQRLRAAAGQASFTLRELLPNDSDAQLAVRMLERALGWASEGSGTP